MESQQLTNTEGQQQQSVERQTAKIVSLKEITTGKYVKQEGWDPNYIHTIKDDKVSRANTLGVVVTIPDSRQSVFIDDGTAKIEIRSFENKPFFADITIGDIILVIGRPREYNNEIYINAEIVRKITNKGWLEYRKKEISLRDEKLPTIVLEKDDFASTEQVAEEESVEAADTFDAIILKIKDLDSGNGCDVSELIEQIPEAESLIEQLMMKGEIFELAPGKIKVLE